MNVEKNPFEFSLWELGALLRRRARLILGLTALVGVVALLVSMLRERLTTRKSDKYSQEIER